MSKDISVDDILEEFGAQEPEKAPETAEAPEADKKAADKKNAGKKAAPEEKKPSELELLKQQHAELNDKHLRVLAEYDNFRRRSKQERETIYSDVRADTVTKFLPIFDNLSRAAEHEQDEEAKKGAIAILNQFRAVLAGLGVTEIEAVGKRFDPALHNAVLHIDDEKYGESEIVLELSKGFKLGDKVIRFSAVQVAN